MPATASAGTKSQSVTLSGSGSKTTLNPKCSKGQRASGGGFLASPPGASYVTVEESRKVGQRTWRVSASMAGSGPLSVTAFAYCSANAPRTKEKSKTSVIPLTGNHISTLDAACGGAGKAMAGGFSILSTSTSYAEMVDSFRADKKTWRIRAVGQIGSPTPTSYVYCADEPKPAARTGSTSASTPGTVHTALSGECKRGTKPVAGGFSQPNASREFAPTGYFFVPHQSFRTGKRWQASGQHFGPASTTLNSIAYCA
jgi:hypothetical protein